MIGQKGVPATYGGVEHHVEQLGARLAARGHHVDVFCRPTYDADATPTYLGMHRRTTWTVGTKHLDAIVHSLVSSAYSVADRPDIVHYHALGPTLAAPLVRGLSSARLVVTVHGLDHERAKWGPAAHGVLGLAHWMTARVPHATVVVSQALAEHYAERFDRRCTYIPNGVASPVHRPAVEIRRRWGLQPGGYVLYVGRLVPEKAPDLLLRAYRQVPGDLPLVVAGGSSFTDGYVAGLQEAAGRDPRVRLCGYVYGDTLAELYSNAAVFVQPSLLEGMPLTLLEAASYGTPVVASDIAPHREIAGKYADAAHLFPTGDADALADRIKRVITAPDPVAAELLRRHVLTTFQWDAAALALERLYLDLTA